MWLAFGLLLLGGCSKTVLVKDGLTPQQFEADKFDCEQKVITMYGGYANMGLGHAVGARQDMFRCMQAKGYREATSEEVNREAKTKPEATPVAAPSRPTF